MNETTIKAPATCSLFEEMKKAYTEVLEAKENAAAWNKEAASRMKNVNILIQAQRRIDAEAPDRAAFVEALKAAFATAEEAAENNTTEEQ